MVPPPAAGISAAGGGTIFSAVFSGVGFSKKCLQFAGKYDIILSCQKTQLTEWMDSRVAKGDRL